MTLTQSTMTHDSDRDSQVAFFLNIVVSSFEGNIFITKREREIDYCRVLYTMYCSCPSIAKIDASCKQYS